MNKIFISYSHKDQEWKEKLVTHLGVLEKQYLLQTWNDEDITVGDNWYFQIEQALNSSSVAILLITADFLNSDFILKKEIPQLIGRRQKDGLKILPLIIKPCLWKEVMWLKSIQVRPKTEKYLQAVHLSKLMKS